MMPSTNPPPRGLNPNDPKDQALIDDWIHLLKLGQLIVVRHEQKRDHVYDRYWYQFYVAQLPHSRYSYPSPTDYALTDILIGVLNNLADITYCQELSPAEFVLEISVSNAASRMLQIQSQPKQSALVFHQAIQQMTKSIQSASTIISASQYQQFMQGIKEGPTTLPVEKATEAIVGYRDFDLDVECLMLKSRNGALWEPREKLIALCNSDPFAAHDAPHLGCACGIYAFNTPKHASLDKTRNIWGEVYLWGEVLECDTGYRAEFAYPKSIFVRDKGTKAVKRLAEQLGDDYGVPTLLMKERTEQTLGEIMETMIQELMEAK